MQGFEFLKCETLQTRSKAAPKEQCSPNSFTLKCATDMGWYVLRLCEWHSDGSPFTKHGNCVHLLQCKPIKHTHTTRSSIPKCKLSSTTHHSILLLYGIPLADFATIKPTCLAPSPLKSTVKVYSGLEVVALMLLLTANIIYEPLNCILVWVESTKATFAMLFAQLKRNRNVWRKWPHHTYSSHIAYDLRV